MEGTIANRNYGEKKLNSQAEHGVDSGAGGLGRRRSTFKRRKRRLLDGSRWSHRLLHIRLIRGGSWSRSRRTASCKNSTAIVIDGNFHGVHLVIVARNFFARATVALDQRLHGALELFFHQPTHLQHLRSDTL